MTELFAISDGGQVDTQGDGDKQKLIEDGFGWRKVKHNKYKLLLAGLTVLVLVSCVAALVVTLSGDSNTNESSAAGSENMHSANHESQEKSYMAENDGNDGEQTKHKGNEKKHSANQESQENRFKSPTHGNAGKRGRENIAKGNSNEGTQFAIAFSAVFRMSDTDYFECVVSTRESSTVRFESPYLSLNKTVSLAAGVHYTESFANSIKTQGGIEDKGVYIHANCNIVVQCAGYSSSRLDSFLALPYGQEDKEFYIAVCGDQPANSGHPVGFVNVVATADNTKVDITCPSAVPECESEEYSIELDLYQTYSIYVYINSDLTGFYISASKPVSVYAGSLYLELSELSDGNSQSAVFSVPPRQTLGTLHYTPQTWGEPHLNHRLRIVATDTTTLSIPQYGVNQTLQSKEYFTQEYLTSSGPVEVACTVPCLVIHCNKQHADLNQSPAQVYMTRITPVETFTDDVVFSSIDYFGNPFDHYLSIVVNQFPVTDLYLDGISLSDNEWIPNEIGDYATVMLSVSPALHRLDSSNTAVKFSGYCHGYIESSQHSGYGSQAGFGAAVYVQPDTREPPLYKIKLWGNFSSLNGDDFDGYCTGQYSNEFGSRATGMIPVVNDLLGSDLCSGFREGDFLVASTSYMLTTSGPDGITRVDYHIKLDPSLRIDTTYDCALEVTYFLMDHENWGIPLLPVLPGCPFPNFDPPRFYDDGGQWVCISRLQGETPTTPGYEFQLVSNFTTFSGEDLSVDCALGYTEDLYQRMVQMQSELNDDLGSAMCPGISTTVLTGSSSITYQGSQGIADVKYVLKSDDRHRFEQIFSCTDEVIVFLIDHINWGIPLLPQIPGCPLLVFHNQMFYETYQEWVCFPNL